MRRQMAWNVPMVMRLISCRPARRDARRSRISRAALLVKVTHPISDGATPRSPIRYAARHTSVCVLPVPGPACTDTTGESSDTASHCRSLRPMGCAASCASVGTAASCAGGALRRGTGRAAAGRGVGETGSAPSRLICPPISRISSGCSRRTWPYSPSKPASSSTFPSRRRRMPSATQGPATRCTSATEARRRISSSGPSARRMASYWRCTLTLDAPRPTDAAITSASGARRS